MDGLLFGQWLRERRIALGWSQNELAAEAGVNIMTVSMIENGLQDIRKSRVETLCNLTAACNAQPGDFWGFICGTPQPPAQRV